MTNGLISAYTSLSSLSLLGGCGKLVLPDLTHTCQICVRSHLWRGYSYFTDCWSFVICLSPMWYKGENKKHYGHYQLDTTKSQSRHNITNQGLFCPNFYKILTLLSDGIKLVKYKWHIPIWAIITDESVLVNHEKSSFTHLIALLSQHVSPQWIVNPGDIFNKQRRQTLPLTFIDNSSKGLDRDTWWIKV